MLNRRHVGTALALGLTALATTPLVVTGIERLQSRETANLLPHEGDQAGGAVASVEWAAVVFYSRSRNTAWLARHLAKRLNARLFQLEAQDYALGLAGWANALHDAQHQSRTTPV